jgi:hypothetical protein
MQRIGSRYVDGCRLYFSTHIPKGPGNDYVLQNKLQQQRDETCSQYCNHACVLYLLSSCKQGRPGKDPGYPLDRRLGGIQSRYGHRLEKKKTLPLPGVEPWSFSLQSDTIQEVLKLFEPANLGSKSKHARTKRLRATNRSSI